MTDKLWKIYDANKEWIKFADTKAIAFIAIIGVLFNFIYKINNQILCLSNYNILKIIYSISIILLTLSLISSVCCLIPRTSKTNTENKNIIYYKAINDNFNNENEYYNSVKKVKNFEEQLSTQNYQLAKVATKKYKIVKCSLILFKLGFIAILIFTIFLTFGVSFNVI